LHLLQVAIDLALIAVAYFGAFGLRFDLTFAPLPKAVFWHPMPWILAAQMAIYFAFGAHQIVWRYVSLWDVTRLTLVAATDALVAVLIVKLLFGSQWFPQSIYLLDPLLILILLGGVRGARRMQYEFPRQQTSKRILIYGAGDAGEMIVRDMKHNPYYGYLPVGFVDDDRAKVGRRIHGYRVFGTRTDLPRIVNKLEPDEILLSMPRVAAATVREIMKALAVFKIPVKTLPNLRDLVKGDVTVSDIRDVNLADLLGRAQIDLGTERVQQLVSGKRILVTGAGGSIGAELCRQIWALGPRALIMFEKHENSLFYIDRELRRAEGGGDELLAVIGDVCDNARLAAVFAQDQIDIVFHAAAHKHVPLMEKNPCEAIKNNVRGTRRLATAAAAHGVERFILVSTDKAVNPSSVMGASKRVAELAVRGVAQARNCRFAAVRFGNVIGSNGSVVPIFLDQIAAGGPITVTDREMRRYFMLIPEAVALMLHSASIIEPGAIYVLEMGEQRRVDDLARDLARLSGRIPGKDIEIEYTGARPGEKMSEELIGSDEHPEPTAIDSVTVVRNGSVDDPVWLAERIKALETYADQGCEDEVLRELRVLVPTFRDPVAHRLENGK
jgi:FlaA1/EpsC-like NDP-sugar epimerase